MELQDVLTQTLYAQLREDAAVFDSMQFDISSRGSAYKLNVDNRSYWYWQISTPGGLKKSLIGRDSEETRAVVARLESQKKERSELLDGLKRSAAAFIASGGMANEAAHFRIMEKLATAGLFRKGLLLVGSHGFVAIGNALGVRWQGNMKTTDMDFARADNLALAIPGDSGETLDVRETAKDADPSFFMVPELDSRKPSSSLMSRKTRVKLDFLTTQRFAGDFDTRYFSDIGIAATPLRFMDYLLSGQNFKGLVVGSYGVPISLPEPARFAIHKLIIAQERSLDRDIKANKDIRQADELLAALDELGTSHEIETAIEATVAWPGAIRNIEKSLSSPHGVSDRARQLVTPMIQRIRRK